MKFSSLTKYLCGLFLGLIFSSTLAIDLSEQQKPQPFTVKTTPQKIVVSLKPYALLLENIKRQGDEVSVLIADGANAHDFQLRPSHLKKIAEADLIIWSGADAEPSLAKVLNNKKQLPLMEVQGLDLISSSEAHSEHNNHHSVDPHIWFSQHNALLMARAMAEALYYPEEALNAINMRFKLLQSEQKLKNNPSSNSHAQKKMLMVYHNAYSYLEKDMHVQHSFIINESHNSKPGLRHWNALKEKLIVSKKSNQSLCIVTQPGFAQSREAKQLEQLLNSTAMKEQTIIIEIDPLASTAHYKDYFEFYADSKNKLLNCMNSY